jgi:nickel-dependent lactate racemase
VRDGGAVILVAECPEGYGSKAFYEWSRNFRELKEVEREIKRRYVIGCEGTYCLLKAREKARVYLVSVMPDYYASNIFNLRTARTTNSALQAAQRTLGKDAKITVIPHALMILPRREERLIIDGT